MLNVYWLPTIKAAMDLDAKNPAVAVESLEVAAPYELGQPPQFQFGTLYPVYVRGQAQLMANNGVAAAAEFQKFLGHRGITLNVPLGALAHLGLARSYALQARTSQGADAEAARSRALAAYNDFFTLWKDADPDIPILVAAKSESAKL